MEPLNVCDGPRPPRRAGGVAGGAVDPQRLPIGASRGVGRHGHLVITPLAVPQLAPCASSGRAWRLWAARHSQSEAQPLGAQPRPQLLERAASNVAHFAAFVHLGNDSAVAEGLRHAYSLDLQLYAHARMLFCRALAGVTARPQRA